MRGIAGYGVYVPHWRLDRKSLATALGAPSGSGTRSVAGYDEDTTSLGVEAARAALRAAPRLAPEALYFATALPAYLDKTNATAIHAALDLAPSAPAFDMAGAVRSGAGALRAALDARGVALAVLADIRTGLPGGAGAADRGGLARRRLRRHRLADHGWARRARLVGGRGHAAPGGRPGELRELPHLARLPPARAAATARSPAPRGTARRAGGGVEVRFHRQPLPGVRRPASAAAARVREVPRRGPDGSRTARGRPGDDRDVHGGPARVLALATRRGRGHRLRGRRQVPVRADRCRSRRRADRRSGGDDVPAAPHRRLGAQLLLEGPADPLTLLKDPWGGPGAPGAASG